MTDTPGHHFPQQAAEPSQQVTDLCPEAMERWNAWLRAGIRSAMRAYLDMVANEMGTATGQLARELDAACSRIVTLEQEVAMLRAMARGEVSPLAKGNKNAA